MRFVGYHRMAPMSSREFDVNGHRRWETKVLRWSHVSQRTQATSCQCGLLCDGCAFAARISGSKEAVAAEGDKRRVR